MTSRPSPDQPPPRPKDKPSDTTLIDYIILSLGGALALTVWPGVVGLPPQLVPLVFLVGGMVGGGLLWLVRRQFRRSKPPSLDEQAIAAYVIAFSFGLAFSDNIWGDGGSVAWASRLVLAAAAGVIAILAIVSWRRLRPGRRSGA